MYMQMPTLVAAPAWTEGPRTVMIVGGSVTNASSQVQPGVPAQSSAESEMRGASRCSRETVVAKQLLEEDLGLAVESPRLARQHSGDSEPRETRPRQQVTPYGN